MFSEIRQGILPLALRNIKRLGDLERAGLLIESLAKHWRDSKPFELLIIRPQPRCGFAAVQPAALSQHRGDRAARARFLPGFQSFYLMTGWYRQQIVKLHVPAVLGFGGYFTLDSDVCCVGDFDSRSFVQDDRAPVALGAQAASRLVAERRPR